MQTYTLLLTLSLVITSCTTQPLLFIPDDEPYKSHQENNPILHQLPQLSLEKMDSYITQLKPTKINAVTEQLSNSFTCNIALLPPELKLKIITHMFDEFDNAEQLATAYYKSPLWYSCKQYTCIKKLLLDSPLPNKKDLIHFFRLPMNLQEKVIHTLDPSFITQYIYEHPIISKKTIALIQKYDPSIALKLLNNQNILLVTKDEAKNPAWIFAMSLVKNVQLLGLIGICLYPYTCQLYDDCDNTWSTVAAFSCVLAAHITPYLARYDRKTVAL